MPPLTITPCAYILASQRNGTLYIGVTANLPDRIMQHKLGQIDGFTKVHNIKTLVYYEMHHSMEKAILREKRLKVWKRNWKLRLIERMNPEWIDLFDENTGELLTGPADRERFNL